MAVSRTVTEDASSFLPWGNLTKSRSLNAAQRNRHAAMLRASGYEDGSALTVQSTDGDIPHGRELSFAWLGGTVMTGLTSVVLMGAALYVAFLGQGNFSTPFQALQIGSADRAAIETPASKTARLKPVAQTRSDREVIEASIRVDDEGVSRIRRQPFERIKATLATSATNLSADIPAWDPAALLNRTQSQNPVSTTELAGTDIYGAEVDGEITVSTASLPLDTEPPQAISDQAATEFVRLTLEGAYAANEITAMGYAAESSSVIELESGPEYMLSSVAENVTVMPQTTLAGGKTLGRSERVLTVREVSTLSDTLEKNGYTPVMIEAVKNALQARGSTVDLPVGSHLRILFGPNRTRDTLIPYRTSIYVGDGHAATVALTDSGQYVLGQAPPAIEFPEEDTEQINVNNLPTIYRSIWETGRKYGLSDENIDRIVAMYAYDLDLTNRISVGDSLQLLQTAEGGEDGDRELLHVALVLDGVQREFFRYQSEDGEVDFYDPNGETGKRFLNRRPVQGGGRMSSRFGYRTHPIFGTRKLHSGVDFSAPTGTPIYAAGDGVVKRAQWVSGYGRYVELRHANGYETAYAHMNRIVGGLDPGDAVRQGEVVGYVGSTGYSTGPHLHFEVKVNGRPVDPLSVRLPRAKTLPARDQIEFAQTVEQVRELMDRETEPQVTVASN